MRGSLEPSPHRAPVQLRGFEMRGKWLDALNEGKHIRVWDALELHLVASGHRRVALPVLINEVVSAGVHLGF